MIFLLLLPLLPLAGWLFIRLVFGSNQELYSTRQREKIRTSPWWSHW